MKIPVLMLLMVFLVACGQASSNVAVPLDDVPALEKLANAFKDISRNHRLSPSALRPNQKKRFLMQVFDKAGYGYLATLQQLAQDKNFDRHKKYHKDLAELVLFAHLGRGGVDKSTIYSAEELRHVRIIEKRMGY